MTIPSFMHGQEHGGAFAPNAFTSQTEEQDVLFPEYRPQVTRAAGEAAVSQAVSMPEHPQLDFDGTL